jgi:HSP20 family protein
MAELTVRKGTENKPALAREWDPFRWAREMMAFEPFRAMAWPEAPGYLPDFDVKETKEGVLFKADLPGVKESDVEVTLTGNRLTITGKREAEKEEKTDTYYMTERSFGSFTRVFTLPGEVEVQKVHAEMKNGVLTILVPHAPNAMPKKIAVKS